MIINTWFPTAIASSDCPFIDDIIKPYKQVISFYKYEKTGFCRERVHLNPFFYRLNSWIDEQVNKFAKAHKYTDQYTCKESWLLDYPKGGGQSNHRHPGFVFSVVFFLEGYENDTPINFHNPVVDMMNPINESAYDDATKYEDRNFNELTNTKASYAPKSGRLLIWRSHILHGVYNKELDCKRIVFTYNYNKK